MAEKITGEAFRPA